MFYVTYNIVTPFQVLPSTCIVTNKNIAAIITIQKFSEYLVTELQVYI